MLVFWENGFRSTTYEQLTSAMDLKKQSVYGAFGDKRLLFLKALRLYRGQILSSLEETISQPGSTIAILEEIYRSASRSSDRHDCPEGCLIVNTALEFGRTDKEIAREVSKLFEGFELNFCRLVKRGQKAGEITDRFDCSVIALGLVNSLSGLRVLEKTGVSDQQIEEVLRFSINQIKK